MAGIETTLIAQSVRKAMSGTRAPFQDAQYGSPFGRKGATILAVDDEPEALDVLRALFVVEGYDFEQAANARQALSHVQARKPNLLIVDYMMPGMSGIELCGYLRANPATADIAIIVYTAYPLPASYLQKELFDRVFVKPADHEELLDAVRALLSQPR